MADSNRHQMTAENLEAIKEELHRREHEIRDEINARLQQAREFGDLSENSEYDAAREERDQNNQRISDLRNQIATAVVYDPTAVNAGDLTAAVGTEVELEDAAGHRLTFSLVGTTNINSLLHQISNESPAGEALIGHRAGDDISFLTPAGKTVHYRIVSVRVPVREDSEA